MILGGLHVIGLLDGHVAIACVPVVCGLELVGAVYTYGPKRLSQDMMFMTGRPIKQFWFILWRYIIPVLLLIIAVYSLTEASGVAGWCVALVSVICVPIHATRVLWQAKGSLIQRIRESCKPNADWGPDEPEVRERWKIFQNQHNTAVTSIQLTTKPN